MKEILICDLDGTLVEYPGVRRIPWNPLRITILGIVSWLFSFLQVRWARPTPTYEKIKELGIDFVVVTGRTHFLKEPYKTINKLLGQNLKKEKVFLRDGSYGFFDRSKLNRFKHKEKIIKELQKKYEILAVVEDEARARRKLKEKMEISIIPPDPEKIEELK